MKIYSCLIEHKCGCCGTDFVVFMPLMNWINKAASPYTFCQYHNNSVHSILWPYLYIYAIFMVIPQVAVGKNETLCQCPYNSASYTNTRAMVWIP